jgi:hypothetical protein
MMQEKGEIFFFYRPKVDKDEAHGPDDVQRMYIVLRPESAEDRAVEEKQAPDSGKEGRKHHRQGDGNGGGAGKEGGHHEGGHGKEVCPRATSFSVAQCSTPSSCLISPHVSL